MQKKVFFVSLLAFACATSALAAKDKFDREALGNKWGVPSGSLYINNNQLQGDSMSLGYFKKSGGATQAAAKVVLNGTDLQYGAVAVGDVATGNNIFVKIQQQNGSGMFEYGGFYVGNNSGVLFFSLDAPMASPATLTASLNGSVATMTIKSSSGTQSYQYDYGTGFGTGGGLGTYGAVSLDNYKSTAPAEELAIKPVVVMGTNAKDMSLSR
jgi:hypothetical protein